MIDKFSLGFCLAFVLCRIYSLDVNFVVVVIGENPAYGYFASLPYFEASFQEVAKLYPTVFANMTRQVIYKPNISDCVDSAAAMNVLTGKIYQAIERSSAFNIIIAPGCSLELVPLGDFAREMNVPLLASTSTDAMFANAQRYSTFLSFGSTGQGGHGPAIKAFLDYYNWTTLTLFCDAVSAVPPIAPNLGSQCRSATALLNVVGKYDFYTEFYDSKVPQDYVARLRRAKRQSRVIIILACADELRKILIAAHSLNMTNNEYVFLNVLPVQGPGFIPLEIETGSEDDKVLLEAWRYLITLNYRLPDYVTLAPFIDSVALEALTKFHYNYSLEEKNSEIMLAIPEMMMAVAEVLDEFDTSAAPLTTSVFRNALLNRSFQTDIRPVVMGGFGMRLCDSVFSRFDTTSQKLEAAWYYNFAMKLLSKTSQLANDWNGARKPPRSVPECGYQGDRCTDGNDTTAVFAGSVCGVVVIAVIILLVACRIKRAVTLDKSDWFLLDPQPYESIADELARESGIRLVRLGNQSLCIRIEKIPVRKETALLMPNLRILCSQLRNIHHDNIADFLGIVIVTANITAVVWDGGRDTLRSLLSRDIVIPDGTVQLCFIFNIVQGLSYIHSHTSLRYHGSLSSLSIVLDSRFTAKICDIGSKSVCHILYKCPFIITEWGVLTAPERKVSGSQGMDIFALGVIMYEILKGRKVTPREPIDITSVTYTKKSFQKAVVPVILQCLAADPLLRPTVRQVKDHLRRFRPKGTVVGNMLERLEEHAENLENLVILRTRELIEEQQKVDLLLKEILPSSIVVKLRNKVAIPPESFDAVTILFSSMVGFDIYCKTKSPVEVELFLNGLYTLIDGCLASFDVYKVETIKDGYVVASGVPVRNGKQHAKEVARFALLMLQNCSEGNLKSYLPIRIGIHTGSIAAGVVGSVMPRYCLFGDTMNTASRMESHGKASRIHVSPITVGLLDGDDEFSLEPRGAIDVKGKGIIKTFWLLRP